MCVCCRKGLEKEWDLEQVLTKAFLQVDAALAAEVRMYGNGTNMQNYMPQKHIAVSRNPVKNFPGEKCDF